MQHHRAPRPNWVGAPAATPPLRRSRRTLTVRYYGFTTYVDGLLQQPCRAKHAAWPLRVLRGAGMLCSNADRLACWDAGLVVPPAAPSAPRDRVVFVWCISLCPSCGGRCVCTLPVPGRPPRRIVFDVQAIDPLVFFALLDPRRPLVVHRALLLYCYLLTKGTTSNSLDAGALAVSWGGLAAPLASQTGLCIDGQGGKFASVACAPPPKHFCCVHYLRTPV